MALPVPEEGGRASGNGVEVRRALHALPPSNTRCLVIWTDEGPRFFPARMDAAGSLAVPAAAATLSSWLRPGCPDAGPAATATRRDDDLPAAGSASPVAAGPTRPVAAAGSSPGT